MSRKVLYSPGYGAGWSSWGAQGADQTRFMCEYGPFIEFLEAGGKFGEGDTRGDFSNDPLVQKFLEEWKARFPGTGEPYLGGLHDLSIREIGDGEKYRIHEYDGSERVVIQSEEEWY